MTPELWHLAFALAGAALGWWLRHQSPESPAAPSAPSPLVGVLAALERALTQRQQQQAHQDVAGLLSDIVAQAPARAAPKG